MTTANHRDGTAGHEPLVQLRLPGGPKPAPVEVSRRDALSMMGFSLGAAGLAACRAPVQHAIPLSVASPELTPGVSRHYATTCGGCASACALLVKQRDGRPIKIEGNPDAPLFGGGTCAAGQATVLELYDEGRLRGPTWEGRATPWPEVDRRVRAGLDEARASGRQVVFLSGTSTSPSLQKVLAHWRAAFPNFRHVVYDAVSLGALRAAHREAFGRAAVPHYRFERARVVVGLDADFLGTWLSPVEFARGYTAGRTADGPRAFHAQVEAGLSVTGSNADLRLALPPSELGIFALGLLADVVRRLGLPELADVPALPPERMADEKLAVIAAALWSHRGESLVVTGSGDVAVQTVVAALNALLGNVGAGEGTTVDLGAPSLQRQGDDAAFEALVADMNRGAVHTLVMRGVNPAYDAASGARFTEALGRVPLSVSLADRADETSVHARAVCPDHHFLESWGDAEPVEGQLGLTQPLIAPLHDTRAAVQSLLTWLGRPSDPYEHLRGFWERSVFPHQREAGTFDEFWDRALERGFATIQPPRHRPPVALVGDWRRAARVVAEAAAREGLTGAASTYEVHLHESVAVRDGRHGNNPWLQELPDPITKVTWGNVAAIAPRTAAALGLVEGDVVSLRTARGSLELPVFLQAGQDARTVSVALGYGRTRAGVAGDGVGANAFPLAAVEDGARRTSLAGVEIVKTGRRVALAITQTHASMEGRPIAQEISGGSVGEIAAAAGEGAGQAPTLWAERPHGEHRWGMAIDLDKCTGCSACVVACQAENNIPVVGADQVQRGRVMHWLRIDRYHGGPDDAPTTIHQPMMCQHCGHAPCETVCPVLATTTSSEGLNQQVYNRCIGTRYCANNCPYKVRRFNWYDYTEEGKAAKFPGQSLMLSSLGRLVLNPDVTVRTRGVMEKCSLCVQRIQQGKNEALQRREPLRDGDVHTACEQACPTGAITFGDLDDQDSRAARLLADRRAYRVLDELGTRPNVGYLRRIRS